MGKLIGAMAVTFMLAVGSHAEATCAWVLWVRAAPTDGVGVIVGEWTAWVPHGATTRADGCSDLAPKNPEENLRAIRATGLNPATSQLASLTWQCLPDTVDPRGPKGGGR